MSNLVPLASLSGEAVAWVAVVTSLVALSKQGYDLIRNRRREQEEIEEALDRQPLVREQLELGNVGEAVKHLSAIIAQMSEAKVRDDRAAEKRTASLEREEDELRAEVAACEERARQLNADWQRRYDLTTQEWERRYSALDERCRKITAVLRRHGWDIDET